MSGRTAGMSAMKITAVRSFRVEGEGPAWEFEDRSVESLDRYPGHVQAAAGARDAPTHLSASYVEIETDEGPSGLYGPIDLRQAFLIATDLRPFLLGADPLATELLHDQMLRLHRHGRSGLFVTAVSAVDNALWDLRGKAAGEPVYRLLGGPTRDRVPVYASMLGHSVEPERAAAAAAEHVDLGSRRRSGSSPTDPLRVGTGSERNLAMATRGPRSRRPRLSADVRRVHGLGRHLRRGHAPRARTGRAALGGGAGAAGTRWMCSGVSRGRPRSDSRPASTPPRAGRSRSCSTPASA